jgi:hypothetical protein
MTFGSKLVPVPEPSCTVFALAAETTCTVAVAVLAPAVAVTVIVRSVGSPAVLSVAVAAPETSDVAEAGATPPEVALKDTGTLSRRALLASRTYAVIVAELDPSDGMVEVLETSVNAATVATVPTVPPLLELLLLLLLLLAPAPVLKEVVLSLPQALSASASAAIATRRPYLRIIFT